MGHCRNLLPVDKIDAFKAWLSENGYEVRESKSDYAAFDLRMNNKSYGVYVREKTHRGNDTVHASIYGPVVGLAHKFLNGGRQ